MSSCLIKLVYLFPFRGRGYFPLLRRTPCFRKLLSINAGKRRPGLEVTMHCRASFARPSRPTQLHEDVSSSLLPIMSDRSLTLHGIGFYLMNRVCHTPHHVGKALIEVDSVVGDLHLLHVNASLTRRCLLMSLFHLKKLSCVIVSACPALHTPPSPTSLMPGHQAINEYSWYSIRPPQWPVMMRSMITK